MTDETAQLLERVFAALNAAEGDQASLMERLTKTNPDARVLAVLKALLTADVSLRETFVRPDQGPAEADLARAAALTLAKAADLVEKRTDTGAALTLSKLTF